MEILIRNMVCRHCVSAVRKALEGAGFTVRNVELGRAEIECPSDSLDENSIRLIDEALEANDFERIKSPESQLVEKIKHLVIKHLRDESQCRLNLSACIASHLNVSYDQASRVFSHLEGRTIERYSILQKVEYVKELMGYGRMTLAEIADKTGYSSVAHLSRQFKDVTGMTPTQYLSSGVSARNSLDRI